VETYDPDDGITAELNDRLAARAAANKISTWFTLWRALFPTDRPEDIPSSGGKISPLVARPVRVYLTDTTDRVRASGREQQERKKTISGQRARIKK